jgi:hypothetical protein
MIRTFLNIFVILELELANLASTFILESFLKESMYLKA